MYLSRLSLEDNLITAEIIRDCRKGKRKAQQKFFDLYADQMFNVCQRYIGNTAEAEDMLSQGFMRVFDSLPGFEYRDFRSLTAWVKKIMVNECLMGLRKYVNFSMVTLNEFEEISYQDHGMERMEVQDILNSLELLPPGYKTVLSLYAIEDYSHKEIAEALQISEGTSRSQLNKARKLLKEKLDILNQQYGRRSI